MKSWLPLVVTILWFTITDLADIATTFMFLGTPFCHEANPFYAPFSNNLSLLSQAYFTSWFFAVGMAVFTYLFFRSRFFNPFEYWWVCAFSGYWILWFWGFNHLSASLSNYQVVTSGVCW